MTSTAVLVIGFRRPVLLERLLERVWAARPARCYVACDGPNPNQPADVDAVTRVRATINDWSSRLEPRTLFQDTNLGCGRGVSTAISWFFEHESEGIILEDDCLPDPSFFPFCAELLERYRDVSHVMQVAGYNLIAARPSAGSDYVFSNYGWQWGWATWQRAWRHFDLGMSQWPAFKKQGLHRGPVFPEDRIKVLDATHAGTVDTWDYQWAFAMAAQSGLSVVPRVNLVANVGFEGPGGTHYGARGGRRPRQPPAESLEFPLRHPDFLIADPEFDRQLLKTVTRPSLAGRAWQRLRYMMGASRP